MGGKAFLSHLPNATFPRLSPHIYASLKSTLLPRLTPLFQYVGVPHEAPEKEDHGDVDFIVACPLTAIGHEEIKHALGAIACIPTTQADHGGTCHFAVRLADVVTPLPTDAVPVAEETSEAYVQVDVNIRKDARDWENVMIFHSYGDLGMIMGRLAASVGLHLGELGLKMSSQALVPTYSPTFPLSTSIPDILPFFGLSASTSPDKSPIKPLGPSLGPIAACIKLSSDGARPGLALQQKMLVSLKRSKKRRIGRPSESP